MGWYLNAVWEFEGFIKKEFRQKRKTEPPK